jgi:flagellin-like hook-associated protein FlgL
MPGKRETAPMATMSSIALDLCTDLRNIDVYAANRALATELVLTAETKLAAISDYLEGVRRTVGMTGSSAILSGKVEG